MLLACAGCEAPTLAVVWSNTVTEGPGDVAYYPPRTSGELAERMFVRLSPHLKSLYKEVIASYNGGLLVLCAAGLRALLEGICDDKQTGGKNLQEKIEGLRQFLPTGNITDCLHSFRFTGNEALHALVSLKPQEAKAAIEVLDDLMNFLYDLDYKASRLKYAARAAVPIPPTP